jgi:hypothetical protein
LSGMLKGKNTTISWLPIPLSIKGTAIPKSSRR